MPGVKFPIGIWFLSIQREENQSISVGYLNLVEYSKSSKRYVGAIRFGGDPRTLGRLANRSFPVTISNFDPTNGAISFQIDGAGAVFDQDCQFVFEGRYNPLVPPFLTGTAKVPKSFGSQLGGSGEDVLWASDAIYRPGGQPFKMRYYSV